MLIGTAFSYTTASFQALVLVKYCAACRAKLITSLLPARAAGTNLHAMCDLHLQQMRLPISSNPCSASFGVNLLNANITWLCSLACINNTTKISPATSADVTPVHLQVGLRKMSTHSSKLAYPGGGCKAANLFIFSSINRISVVPYVHGILPCVARQCNMRESEHDPR